MCGGGAVQPVAAGVFTAAIAVNVGGACAISRSTVTISWGGAGAVCGTSTVGLLAFTNGALGVTGAAAFTQIALAVQGGTACGVSAGGVVCWGTDTGHVVSAAPQMYGLLLQVALGYSVAYAVTVDANIVSWGDFYAAAAPSANRYLQVAADALTPGGCAITTTGGVVCWPNGGGPTGGGTALAVQLACGYGLCCCVYSDSTIQCWGALWSGPAAAALGPGPFTQVAVGVDVCALTLSGTVVCVFQGCTGQSCASNPNVPNNAYCRTNLNSRTCSAFTQVTPAPSLSVASVCSAGSSGAPSTPCTRCAPGTWSLASFAACPPSPAGYYVSAAGSAFPVPCTVAQGAYCVRGSVANVGVPCAAGSFCSGGNAIAALCACNAGTFCAAATTTGPNAGCIACYAGSYCTGLAAIPAPCACAVGYYCPTSSSTSAGSSCPAGYWCIGGNSSAIVCPAGDYCIAGVGSPTSCPTGVYGSSVGLPSASCTDLCTLGSYCPLQSITPTPCPAGRYAWGRARTNASCDGPCALGYYCPAGSSSASSVPCPASTFGNTTGLGTPACSGPCPLGLWCAAGTRTPSSPCAAGYFGNAVGMKSQTCVGLCPAGYYCPAGTIANTSHACNSSAMYCADGSPAPLQVPVGFYSYPTGGAKATNAYPGSVGSYCAGGVEYPCPAGTYGRRVSEPSPTCTGPCAAGYWCVSGSTTAYAAACGNYTVYCPVGSASPRAVSSGYFSTGGPESGTARAAQEQCGPGTYCVQGVQLECPFGTFGAGWGLVTPPCSGRCSAGYLCPAGSVSSTQQPCPYGFYCAESELWPCPPGTFNDVFGAFSIDNCTSCAPGTANPTPNATLPTACAPCPAREGSEAGAATCWPGIVSVVASNPPPLIPMISPGDIVIITFTKGTNAPRVDTDAALLNFLSFSACVGSLFRASWNHDASAVSIVIGATAGVCGVNGSDVDIVATRIGALYVTVNASSGLRDAHRLSQDAVLPPSPVTGDWGVPKVPAFVSGTTAPYAGAFARNTGGQAGMGVGDTLVLRFDNPCRQVPLARRQDVDALLNFSSPIGADYSGAWDTTAPYAKAGLKITVTAALEGGYGRGTAVGVLGVSVRLSARLTSLDESTAASNASTIVALGTWGDVPGITYQLRSHRSVRVALSPPATMYGWNVETYRLRWCVNASTCFEDGGGSAVQEADVHATTTSVATVSGLALGVPLYLRAAANVHIAYAGEVLWAGMGPFWALPDAVVTRLPVLSGIVMNDGGLRMAARGNEAVLLTGAFLGLEESPEYVSATYSNGNSTYNATSCRVTSANSVVVCNTAAGVGTGFVWTIEVDGASFRLAAPAASTLYNIPVVQDVARIVGGANGGGILWNISGREFGPLWTPIDRAWLFLPSDSRATFYVRPSGCIVTAADSVVQCEEPVGAGANLVWTLVIGGQFSASPSVTYDLPLVSSVSCAPSACNALQTIGGDNITIRGTNFGPMATDALNCIAGTFGGVVLTQMPAARAMNGAPTAASVALVSCAVIESDVLLRCTVPRGFGLMFQVFVTAVGQQSLPSAQFISFAVPSISSVQTNIAGNAIGVLNNQLTLSGSSFGGSAQLIFRVPAAAAAAGNATPPSHAGEFVIGAVVAPNAGDSVLLYSVSVLPLGLVGVASLDVCVDILGVRSNVINVLAATPFFVSKDPITLDDGMPPVCNGLPPFLYWLVLAGGNFGVSNVTTTVMLMPSGGAAEPCSLCSVDVGVSITLGTNSLKGWMTVVVGQMQSNTVLYDVNALLAPPEVDTVMDAATGRQLVTLPTSGGVVTAVGKAFHASYLLFLVPRVLSPALFSKPIVLTRSNLQLCALIWSTQSATQFQCVVPPGVGAAWPLVLYARGSWYVTPFSVSYTPPSITSAVVVGIITLNFAPDLAPPLLPSAGGLIRISGRNFGNSSANLTVLVGGVRCAIWGAVHDSLLSCTAPPGDAAAPPIIVTVAGQTVIDSNTSVGYYPPTCKFFAPNTSVTNGGNHMVLTGANFGYRQPTVTFILPYGLPRAVATVLLSWASDALQVVIPAGVSGGNATSLVSIEIATTAQSVTMRGVFEYDAPAVSRAHGRGGPCSVNGCEVAVVGTNFGAIPVAVLVTLGSQVCALVSVTHSSILCTAPPGSGAQNAVVVTVAFRSTNNSDVMFGYAAPSVFRVSPTFADQRGATAVIIWGANFASTGLVITFGGASCTTAPEFRNSSAVFCAKARFVSIGRAGVIVEVDGQVSHGGHIEALCLQGSYGTVADGACMVCPANCVCGGWSMDPVAAAGYYMISRGVPVACAPPGACLAATPGQNGTNCATGYTASKCSVCATHYYRVGDFCVPCPDNAALLIILFVVFILLIGAAAMWMHRNMFNLKVRQLVGGMILSRTSIVCLY